MSAVSSTDALSAAGLPPISEALLPASVRNGSPAAKSAYETALGFEDVLVNELSKAMMSTVSSESDGSTGSSAASSGYSELLPQALTSSIMSAGGLGIAQQIASSLDPSLGVGATTAATAATAKTGGATT